MVGISGGSGSGKTTFAGALVKRLQAYRPLLLQQDHYFRAWAEGSVEKTANRPAAVMWDALTGHLDALANRRSIGMPVTGSRMAARGAEPRDLSPGHVVFIEGHLLFTHAGVRERLDVKLFMEVDSHERVLRRLLRDARNGGNLERSASWYRSDVLPGYREFIEPTRRYADLVIPYETENPIALDAVTALIRSRLEQA